MPASDPEFSGLPHEPRLVPELLRPIPAGSENENMMLVSPGFDILMLHPSWEALWRRPVSSFLGKKCYREIEKRDDPCPHCPGAAALQTGAAAEAESWAVLDDGSRVPFLLRALPIYGSAGQAVGFVETCENISERRRGEADARLEVALINDLLGTSSVSRVLGLGLDVALQLEGVKAGCAFTIDPESGARELMAERGTMPGDAGTFPLMTVATSATIQYETSLLLQVPILCNHEPVAALVVELRGDSRAWPNTQSRLEVVTSILALALARIRAERLRGDAGLNMQTFISTVTSAALFIDRQGTVTMWNDAAERLFGWSSEDVLGRPAPFVPPGQEAVFLALVANGGEATGDHEPLAAAQATAGTPETAGPGGFRFTCLRAAGDTVSIWLRAAPLRDVTGDGSSHLVVAVRAAPAENGVDPLASESEEHEALVAARSLEQLFRRISNELPLGQTLHDHTHGGKDPATRTAVGDVMAPDAAGPTAATGIAGGGISVSWSQDGTVDIHLRVSPLDKPLPVVRLLESAQALIVQRDEENGRRLEGILREMGCATVVCTSISEAIAQLRVSHDQGRPTDFAIVEMVMPEEPGAVETAKLLRTVEPRLQVVVSSERGVVGHAAHGFAAAISRPYADETVKTAAIEALRRTTL